MKILIITSEWPSKNRPSSVPFLVREVNQLKKIGIDVDVFSFRGNKKLSNYLSSRKKLKNIIKNNSYDILHVHWGYNAILAIPTNIPLVITYRGDDLNGISYIGGIRNTIKSFFVIIISKYVSYFASSLILVTKTFKVKVNQNVPSYVIPSGIDLNIFKPIDKEICSSKIGIDKNKKIILFPGNKTDVVKNYKLANEVLSIVKQKIDDVEMISIPLNTNKDLIPYYMNSADCILFTSIQEGSPNVIKEALACNIPIVSTNVGDVKERLETIDGCFVIDDYDAKNLAEALLRILISEKKIKGRNSVSSLSLENTAKEILSVYKNLLK